MALGLSVIGLAPTGAGASLNNHGQPVVQINPGGGALGNGSDGLRIVVNGDGVITDDVGTDQLYYAGATQFCCSAYAPMLNIGGSLYGEAGPAITSWDDVQVLGVTGSGTTSGGSNTGSGTATVRYTVAQGGHTYTVDRVLSYTYPNRYVTDHYTITIPAGNTDPVKFYLGGDAAPGGSDHGSGLMVTSPVRTVYEVNTTSSIQIGFGEIPGGTPFDGATAQSFIVPYNTVRTGNDIGFTTTTTDHDAGIMMQWTLGSTPGSYDRSLRQLVGAQGAALSGSFRDGEIAPNAETTLDLQVVNTSASAVADLDYTLALPAGLALTATTPASTCGGTLTATAGTATVDLANGSVAAGDSCLVTVGVTAASGGTYTLQSSDVTAINGASNGIDASDLMVTGGSVAPTAACASDEGWTAIRDQVNRLYGATLGRTADAGGSTYWTRLRLHGLTAMDLADNLLASSERADQFGSMTNSAFVDDLYQQVLNRAPDTGGHDYWVGQLDGGLHRAALALYMSDSAENVTRTSTLASISDSSALVCRLYQTILHRSPDADGLSYWAGLLSGGLDRTRVANVILSLPEAASLAAMNDGDFVDSLYQGSLGRSADTDGRTYWSGMVSSAGRGWIAIQLADSWENQSS